MFEFYMAEQFLTQLFRVIMFSIVLETVLGVFVGKGKGGGVTVNNIIHHTTIEAPSQSTNREVEELPTANRIKDYSNIL